MTRKVITYLNEVDRRAVSDQLVPAVGVYPVVRPVDPVLIIGGRAVMLRQPGLETRHIGAKCASNSL